MLPLKLFREKLAVSLAVFLAAILLLTNGARAQVAGATLTGNVMDSSGAVIPKAQVTITDVATGIARKITADNAGLYSAPNLLPATYQVSVSAPGFATEVRNGITLTVGAQQVLDIHMQVGQVTQTVQVTGEAPMVQLASSTISGEVNATTVRELPLNGRSWTDLAKLQPGVVSAETHAAQDVNRGFGAQLSISGARPQQNNYRLDGVSINDYSNGGPGSVIGQNLGVDAIQEFSVLTSNYSAEYGKTSGGVVNAITRSGTNSFHGSAYEFLRNSALDTRNFFDGSTVPPFKRNQFGASAGGPIQKDRTFIFGDYEGVRQSLGTTTPITVPSAAARGIGTGPTGGPGPAILCSNPAGATPPNSCSSQPVTGAFSPADPVTGINQTAAKYLPFFHLPNSGTIGNGDLGIYTFVRQQIVNENYFTTRVDEKISDKDSLFGTYSFDNSPLTQPDILNNVLQSSIARRQIAAVEESHVFNPAFVNSFRVGYNRERANSGGSISTINPAANDTSVTWWAPGLPPPQANLPGVDRAPGFAPPTFAYIWNAYQVYDDAFVTRGLHTLKFGVGVERDQLNETTNTADYLGTFTFKSLSDFLTNTPHSVAGVVPGLATPRYMRLTIAGVYVQDDWRFRPNFTLNLGLRYEFSTVLTETRGKLTNLPTIDAAAPHLGDPYFSNPTLRNLEPRVGFAWDPFRNGKTAVRGGFGMFDVLPMLYTTVTMNGRGAPFFEIASGKLAPGTFASLALPSILAKGGGAFEYQYVEPRPKRNYVMQWNLNVQRELAPNLTALVGYVGSRGVHQAFRADDGNIVLPAPTSAGYIWPVPITNGSFVNPDANIGAIRFLDWGGDSFYNALQAGVQKRMSHGLQIQGSFTWGKSIDEGSGVIAGDTLGNAIGSLPWYDLKSIRGLSDYNIGRVFVVNGSWQIPSIKSGAPPLQWAASGWELGGILTLSDGPPFTPTFGTDGDPVGLNSTDPWDFPDRLTGPGCQSLINPQNPNNYIKTQCFGLPVAPNLAFWQTKCDTTSGIFGPNSIPEPYPVCFNLRGNAGRNIIPGPGLANLDFSIFKNNPIRRISESFNVQFRAEIFNILNRANFADPVVPDDTDIFDSTGAPNAAAGVLKSTTTSSRQIQFALKVIW